MEFIKRKEIYLRGIRKSDLEVLSKYPNDEKITRYMIMGLVPDSGIIYCSTDDIYKEYNRYKDSGDIVFSICILSDTKEEIIIGIVGLYEFNWIARNAELRIVIGNRFYLNKGYGTEVVKLILKYGFDKLNLHKIRLGVNADDERANECYKKCGFIYEGTLRDYHYRNGEYYDANLYSILRREYDKKK